jgi:hypothetical protein
VAVDLALSTRLLHYYYPREGLPSLWSVTFDLLLPGFSLCVGGIKYSYILNSTFSKMRFRRSSTVDDEEGGKKGTPIRLPMMRRNRQSVQEFKENIPPQHDDAHDSASTSPKASRRRTMIDFFKHKPPPKVDEESENGLTRMDTQRTKSVSLRSTAEWQTWITADKHHPDQEE